MGYGKAGPCRAYRGARRVVCCSRGLLRIAGLALVLLTGGCQADLPRERLHGALAGGDPDRGRTELVRYGCGACHVVPGVRGARGLVGPPLESWPRRGYIAGMVPNEPPLLVQFIRDPQSLAPGTAMPNTGVTERAARHIAAYLYSLD